MHTGSTTPAIIIIITQWGSKAVTDISSLLFVSTHRKPPQLLAVFAPSISLIIAIFWSKSNAVCLCLLLIFTHTIRTDAVTCTSSAACNISIPSPAVVSARRGHHPQCASTADVTWLVHCIWCSHKTTCLPHAVASPSDFVHVNWCILVLDGPEMESVLSEKKKSMLTESVLSVGISI